MTAHAEKILDDTVEGEKSLSLTGRLESTHLPLPLAGRLMRNFSAVVGVAVHAMCEVAEDGSHGSRVAPKPVSNDAKRLLSLAMQQPAEESFGSPLVPARLNQDIDHVAVLVDGPPEMLLLAVNSNEDFVQVPGVSPAGPGAASISEHSRHRISDTTTESSHTKQLFPALRADLPHLGSSGRSDGRPKSRN